MRPIQLTTHRPTELLVARERFKGNTRFTLAEFSVHKFLRFPTFSLRLNTSLPSLKLSLMERSNFSINTVHQEM